MAHDVFMGKIDRDWSCGIASLPAPKGKSAAELWDEAESQRLGRPVRHMSDAPVESRTLPPTPPAPPEGAGKVLVGMAAVAGAGMVALAVLSKRRK